MDNFIVKNDSWLQYLPIVMYGMIVIIASLLIVIVFSLYKRFKERQLKSHNRKSPFARAYADCAATSASSSAPITRNIDPTVKLSPITPDRYSNPHSGMSNPSGNRSNSLENRARTVVMNSSVSNTFASSSERSHPKSDESKETNSKVLDFYFEFEEGYKI